MKYLQLILVCLSMLVISCGSDDDSGSSVCTNENCDNVPSAPVNIIGTWTTYNFEGDERGEVVFRSDLTGTAEDESSPFNKFWGNTGESFADFTWSYSEMDSTFLFSYPLFGSFYKVIELDCDYMQLEDKSSFTNLPESSFYRLCRVE